MAGITNNQVVAALIIEEMKDIAKVEGHLAPPPLDGLEDFVDSLEPGERPHDCRWLDAPNQRGYVPSRDIAPLFRRR